ncbi:MAG: MATE family efflux transporter, partial [Desulfovibrionaceae bacterium]|nr:MATE family efflux transporter [Desulfovibrionaceae bacterium]
MPLRESPAEGACSLPAERGSWRHELRVQLGLVLPVLLSQIALMSLGMADTVMTGHAGPLDMPAVALGVSLWQPILLFGQGVVMAVTPAVAQLRGQGRLEDAGQVLRQGLWLAGLISLPVMGLVLFLSHHLSLLGIEGELAGITGSYLRALLPGAPAWLLFVAFRSAMEGFSRVRPAMAASLAAVAVNIPGNWIFIFGKCGFPAMGGVGAGLASSITCWVMLAVIAGFALHMPDFRRFLSAAEGPKWEAVGRIARVGFPGALALLCEVSFFSLVAILLVPFGPIEV